MVIWISFFKIVKNQIHFWYDESVMKSCTKIILSIHLSSLLTRDLPMTNSIIIAVYYIISKADKVLMILRNHMKEFAWFSQRQRKQWQPYLLRLFNTWRKTTSSQTNPSWYAVTYWSLSVMTRLLNYYRTRRLELA